MILGTGFLLLLFTYVQTSNFYNDIEHSAYTANDELPIYSQGLKLRKREAVPLPVQISDSKNDTDIRKDIPEIPKPEGVPNAIGPSEGGGASVPSAKPEHNSTTTKPDRIKVDTKLDPQNGKNITSNSTINVLKSNETLAAIPKQNETAVTTSSSSDVESALQNPGVVKRGLIVFGGFALLAVAYFVFYRKKAKKYDANNSHNTNDTNQFRYGVLQSDDRRDNLELSRIPLTMESDEDDEEDLEIFDLEQKRKSLSYVNLQTNDEDIVLHRSKDESKNNLLLDIEDGPSDTLINWSNTGSNSIL
ncbi:uncharacterized protein LOC123865977 [Maniola jurtina]|uniref:uncharacterized protein LOC123865977 n=1 Tax=Maniola jurtina TaxID=191418 RepID=UPI001E68D27D|nr:uncharacterized protein LOC123865977 [Maniola jurtina]